MIIFLMEKRSQSSPFDAFYEANNYYMSYLFEEEVAKHFFGEFAREEFYEIERQQYEGFEWGIQYGVLYDASKEESLYFFVTVNTDAPYYRSNGAFFINCGYKTQVDYLIHEESIALDKVLEMCEDTQGKYLEELEKRLLHALWPARH